MRLRYACTCARCGTSLAAGTTADYDRASKTVACVACPPRRALPGEAAESAPARLAVGPVPTLEVVDGHGGASATVEFQRRHDARQERVLTNHPRIGGFLLAVFDDPQSTRAWSVGAEGERVLSEMLASLAGESLRVLNDRRIPGTKANIDHLVVCPSGVFVVDAKRYRNSRPELRVEGGLFRARTELLYVEGRDPSGRAGHTGSHTMPTHRIAARPIPKHRNRHPRMSAGGSRLSQQAGQLLRPCDATSRVSVRPADCGIHATSAPELVGG